MSRPQNSTTSTVRLALSTCPNDTFLIHGLTSGAVDRRGLDLHVTFGDVQELNEGLLQGRFDVSKASYALALQHTSSLKILPVGSALGFGVGPVLLAHPDRDRSQPQPTVLCPGKDTTATLLLRLLHPEWTQLQQGVFSSIMPAISERRCDLGVCIHEGRFTYADRGLVCEEDLGASFEALAQGPLPLGGLFARRELDSKVARTLAQVLQDSLEYGWAHRMETVQTMAQHAQEMSEAVLFQHVDLYVNEWTRDLQASGRVAIEALWALALERGLIAPGLPGPAFL